MALDRDLLNQLRQVSLADKEAHTRLVMGLQTNAAVQRHLWMMIQDGVNAEQQIQLRGRRID
jgi:hypothetical protein